MLFSVTTKINLSGEKSLQKVKPNIKMDRKRKMMDRDLLQYGKLMCRKRELYGFTARLWLIVEAVEAMWVCDFPKFMGSRTLRIRNKHKIKRRPSLTV